MEFLSKSSTGYLIIIAVVAFPVLVIQLLLRNYQLILSENTFSPQYIWVGLIYLLSILLGILSFCPLVSIMYLVERGIQNEYINWIGAIRFGLTRIIPLYFSFLVLILILTCLYVLIIIPGVIFTIFWFFSPYVISLRKTSGKKAFDYSMNIVKGQWWRILSSCVFLLVFQLLFFAPLTLVQIIVNLPLILIILIQTISLIIGSFFSVMTTLFFLNVDYVHSLRIDGINPYKVLTNP